MSYATEMNYHMERSTVIKYAEEISHAYSEEIAVQMYITQNITVFNYPKFEVMLSFKNVFVFLNAKMSLR